MKDRMFVQKPYLCLLPGINLRGASLRMMVLLSGIMDKNNTINITYEELSKLMGSSRTSTCNIARNLIQAGLVKHKKGQIRINPKYSIKPDANVDIVKEVYNHD